MKPSQLQRGPGTHDFIAFINSISFDFSGYDWDQDFDCEQEWIDYQTNLTNRYSSFSIYFEDADLPESNDEDETLDEFYESTHCTEEGHYYRILERWIDREIGWCLLGLEYRIEKVVA